MSGTDCPFPVVAGDAVDVYVLRSTRYYVVLPVLARLLATRVCVMVILDDLDEVNS